MDLDCRFRVRQTIEQYFLQLSRQFWKYTTWEPFGDSCDMALKVDEGVYVFSASGTVTYYPLNSQGEMLAPQAQWVLPSYIKFDDGFIEAIQISDDRLLFVGENSATVLELRETKDIIVSRTYAD